MGRTSEQTRVRVVLLGASNLTRCLSVAIATVREVTREPGEYFIAAGHGRSFGTWSRVLGRGLPGTLKCGLWSAFREAHAHRPLPTFAVITDIGNDIMYGQSARTIVKWVTRCTDMLRECDTHVTLTQLPMASIRTVGPKRFAIVKSIMFPTRRITFGAAMACAAEVAVALPRVATQSNANLVEQRAEWFGFDPIHIKPRWKAHA